ncbi:MAG TPA: hypothetical protein ENI32_02490 [Candidatus Syntrophoarchaeum butanivorans]|uniref:Uncharacterized protein n=1 Tax=Candidatus Syntropharchaeum butanivorans TaxID=1839936 RepID=A0A7J2RZT5_9EURY|nr:hypothetical protein [Candidatus Syntrophoarchaeum butanivorans]
MKSLIDYSLNEKYEKVKRLGDRLAEVDSLIDRGAFRMRRIRLIRGIASPLPLRPIFDRTRPAEGRTFCRVGIWCAYIASPPRRLSESLR